MVGCSFCGEEYEPAYTCNYCESKFCDEHRLPEKHNCPAVWSQSTTDDLSSDVPSTLSETASELTDRRPDTSSKEPASDTTDADSTTEDPETTDEEDSDDSNSSDYEPTPTYPHDYPSDPSGSQPRDRDPTVDPEDQTDHRVWSPEKSSSSSGKPSSSSSGKSSSGRSGQQPSDTPEKPSFDSSETEQPQERESGLVASVLRAPVYALGVVLYLWSLPWKIVVKLASYWKHAIRFPLKTITSLKFIAGVVTAVILISAVAGTGIPVIDNAVDDPVDTGEDVVSGVQSAVDDASTVDKEVLRQEIHAEVNERRQEFGLANLTYDPGLEEVADYHSEDMIEDGYFAHESPGGEGLSDRYQRFNIHCPGGENIYLSGERETDESELANETVTSWINSEGHRENILRARWDMEGIGIAVGEYEDRERVMVTQNFC